MRYFVVAVLFSSLFFGCGSSTTRNHVQQLDSLVTEIEKAEHLLDSIDVEKMVQYHAAADENLKYITGNFNDTLNRETAMKFSDYKVSFKSMGRLQHAIEEQEEQLEFSKTQVVNLLNDVKNNFVAEDRFPTLFYMEAEAVKGNVAGSEMLLQWYKTATRTFEKLNPEVVDFVEEMKKNGYR